MSQVVHTIHTYQSAAGPVVEARVIDPNLGDVRLVVTGRAGEIVQAQLVVKDRASAEALTAAAARVHATGDALAGVNVTVRTETGGTSTATGRGGNSEAAALATNAGNGDPASGNGHGSQGTTAGSQLGPGSGGGSGTGSGSGTGAQAGGSHESHGPAASPFDHSTIAHPGRGRLQPPPATGSSLDIRA